MAPKRPAKNTQPIGRQAVLDAALRLYAEGDYSSVTMRAIAQAVGCQSPSLYHYFAGKDEIFQALEEDGVELLLEHYGAPEEPGEPLTLLRTRYWRYFSFSRVHPEYFRLLFVDRSSPQGQKFRRQVLENVESGRRVKACIESGAFPPDTDRVSAALALWCAAHGAAVLGLRNWEMQGKAVDQMAKASIRLVIMALQAGLSFSTGSDFDFADTDNTIRAAL